MCLPVINSFSELAMGGSASASSLCLFSGGFEKALGKVWKAMSGAPMGAHGVHTGHNCAEEYSAFALAPFRSRNSIAGAPL